jgi:hypothetical protein
MDIPHLIAAIILADVLLAGLRYFSWAVVPRIDRLVDGLGYPTSEELCSD